MMTVILQEGKSFCHNGFFPYNPTYGGERSGARSGGRSGGAVGWLGAVGWFLRPFTFRLC